MPRAFMIAAGLLVALSLPACGAGGGGTPATPTAPGVLRAVAIQGQPATGTTSTYALLPTHPFMDAHSSGWVAFVAPTTDVVKTSVLNAMAPDGTVINVFSAGDAVPGLPDGTIDGFGGVWVGDSFLLAHVTITGNALGRTFGIISATLTTGGFATDRTGVFFHMDNLAGIGLADTVETFDAVTPNLESDGTFWFRAGLLTSGETHLFSVERNGTVLTVRARVSEALPFGQTIATVDAFAVEPTGVFYSIVATTAGADRRIYVRNTASPTFGEVMKEMDPIPGTADVIDDIHVGGTLSVYDNGRVVWMGSALGAGQAFLTGDLTGAANVILLAQSGALAPGAGTGLFGVLGGMNLRSPASIPQFSAAVVGSSNGVVFGTYGIVQQPPPVLAADNLTNTTAGPLGPVFVGLSPMRAYREVSQDGSFLFANVLQSGLSAVLWLIPFDNIYGLAVEGEATPGGDTFGSLAGTSAHTVDNGVALFRAPLNAAGSGIYRRGP